MPSNNAWNGKWTGADKNYTKVCNMGQGKKADAHAQKILDNSPYYYDFGDGWTASVSVHKVAGSTIRAARKRSDGFCGYEWMIDSIIMHGEIRSRDAG
jgi:hypothetical protein